MNVIRNNAKKDPTRRARNGAPSYQVPNRRPRIRKRTNSGAIPNTQALKDHVPYLRKRRNITAVYNLPNNRPVRRQTTPGYPNLSAADHTVVVRGTETVGVLGSNSVFSMMLNPRFMNLPNLQAQSLTYNRFMVRHLVITYTPYVGTTTNGEVTMCWSNRFLEYTTMEAFTRNCGYTTGPVHQKQVLDSKGLNMMYRWCHMNGNLNDQRELFTYVLNVRSSPIFNTGGASAGSTDPSYQQCGQLKIAYDIIFTDRQERILNVPEILSPPSPENSTVNFNVQNVSLNAKSLDGSINFTLSSVLALGQVIISGGKRIINAADTVFRYGLKITTFLKQITGSNGLTVFAQPNTVYENDRAMFIPVDPSNGTLVQGATPAPLSNYKYLKVKRLPGVNAWATIFYSSEIDFTSDRGGVCLAPFFPAFGLAVADLAGFSAGSGLTVQSALMELSYAGGVSEADTSNVQATSVALALNGPSLAPWDSANYH